MSKITGRWKKGKLERLIFSGTCEGNRKVEELTTGARVKTGVSFNPDPILFDLVNNSNEVEPSVRDWRILEENKESYIREFEGSLTVHNLLLETYQNKGIEFLKRAQRCILADDYGKYPQAIIAASKNNCILVVCPPHLVNKWESEIERWSLHSIYKIVGTQEQKERVLESINDDFYNKFVILTYPSLSKSQYIKMLPKFQVLIVDKAHRIGNRKTEQTKNVQFLASKTQNLYLLNSSDEYKYDPSVLWTSLNCIDPLRFPSYWNFFERYVEYYRLKTGHGCKIIGPKNIDELNKVLQIYRLKRPREEIKKISERVEIWVDNNVESKIEKKENMDIVEMVSYISALQKEILESKFETIKELVKDSIEEGRRTIVIGMHSDFSRKLYTSLGNLGVSYLVDDRAPKKIRKDLVSSFNQDGEVLYTTYGVIEEDTIVTAQNIIFYELHWNPEVLLREKLHCENPLVFYILCEKSIDKKIWDVLQCKSDFISGINNILKIGGGENV